MPVSRVSSPRTLRNWMTASALAAAGLTAQAQSVAPAMPKGVVNLTASATQELAQDVLSVTLSVNRDGTQAAEVQAHLKQVLEAALKEARSVSRPEYIETRTGAFSLYPRYDNKGRINGWQGAAQLVIEGKDMGGIAQLAGRLSASMNVTQVGYGLSRATREASEATLLSEAIARWQAKAQGVAKAFGAPGYSVGELSIQSGEPGFEGHPVPMMARSLKADMAMDAPLPVAPGKGSVTVTVSGSAVLHQR